MLVLVPAFLAHPNATTLNLDQFAVCYTPPVLQQFLLFIFNPLESNPA